MFKVVASEGGRADHRKLVDWARSRQRCALRYAEYGRGSWLHDLVDTLRGVDPRTLFVRVPSDPDRIERTLLELASGLDAALAEEVATRLRAEPDIPTATLEVLARASGDRRLIVDGWSALESTEDTYAVGHALDARISAVRDWIAQRAWIITDRTMSVPPDFEVRHQRTDAEHAPSILQNGAAMPRQDLWQKFAPSVEDYEVALALVALADGAWTQPMPPAWKLRHHVVRCLPAAARELLYSASVHARPLSSPVIAQLGIVDSAVELLVRLGLCHMTSAGLLAEPAWTAWTTASDEVRIEDYHRRLAQGFASLVDPSDATADRAAIAILEAHRHYLAAGDVEQARRFARYTAANLIEAGKRRSLVGSYLEAARIYQEVLDLADGEQLCVGQRLRAYAKHYVHFNRARAEAESFRETERGYRDSVDRWPDNALFWSRLVRTQVYRGARGDALATLVAAHLVVPDHPEKRTVLRARTVRGLLAPHHDDKFIIDALLVWDDYRPDSESARDVEHMLEVALARGWSTRPLDVPGVEPLWFFDSQRVRISRSADFWFAELQDLNAGFRGSTPKQALTNLIAGVRAEVAELIRAMTHTLDAPARLRKQILLGVVDVITSKLDAPALDHVWLVGDVRRQPDQRLYFVTNDSRVLQFEVPSALEHTVVANDIPYLAKIATGPSGVPVGPLVVLEPAYGSAQAVLEAWLARAHDA